MAELAFCSTSGYRQTPTWRDWFTRDQSAREAFPIADVEAMGYKVYFHGKKHTTVSLCCVSKNLSLYEGFPNR